MSKFTIDKSHFITGELLMKHKIILDTDPGIDDAVMISTALTDPQLDVALITTVAGNVTVDKTDKVHIIV